MRERKYYEVIWTQKELEDAIEKGFLRDSIIGSDGTHAMLQVKVVEKSSPSLEDKIYVLSIEIASLHRRVGQLEVEV